MILPSEFRRIQALKGIGLNKNQVHNRTEICYNTVARYWDMSQEEFDANYKKVHSRKQYSKGEKYRKEILELLKTTPELSSAQIYDRLEEKYKDKLDIAERTVYNYVRELREEYNLPKNPPKREFTAVRDVEPGSQAQVDFGEIWVPIQGTKEKIKLHCFEMILSFSRYRYVLWQDHPFTTDETIQAHDKAFEYFGGRPEEIVYDQDSVIVVSENKGELVFTDRFSNYIESCGFETRVCRPADPQSKGKIERAIGYVKRNFAYMRDFTNITEWNADCLAWLDRRGNGKANQTTKRIPAELFKIEKKCLIPVGTLIKEPEPIITYMVQKDNTVIYRGNRYEVPKGTYTRHKQVRAQINEETIIFSCLKTGKIIQTHEICHEKGKLITIPENDRPEISHAAREAQALVEKRFGNSRQIKQFTEKVCELKGRYALDQFNGILGLLNEFSMDKPLLVQALEDCIEIESFTFGALEKVARDKLVRKKALAGEKIYGISAQDYEQLSQKYHGKALEEAIEKKKRLDYRFSKLDPLYKTLLEDPEGKSEEAFEDMLGNISTDGLQSDE